MATAEMVENGEILEIMFKEMEKHGYCQIFKTEASK